MTRAAAWESTLAQQLITLGLPEPEREYRFHPTRKWRFDLAYPDMVPKLAIEIEGGSWIMGRHNRAKGFQADLCKYNAAVGLGWRILRYTPQQVRRMVAAMEIEEILRGRG
jgi:hypothetical protein